MDTRPLAFLPKLDGIMTAANRQIAENIVRSLVSDQVFANIMTASYEEAHNEYVKLIADKTLTEDQIRVLASVRNFVRMSTALKISTDWLSSLPEEDKVEDIVRKLDLELEDLAKKEVKEFKKFLVAAKEHKSSDKEVKRAWFWEKIDDMIDENIEPALRHDIDHQTDVRVEQFHIMLRSRLSEDIMYKFITEHVFVAIEDGTKLEDVLAHLEALFKSEVFKKHVEEVNKVHDRLSDYIKADPALAEEDLSLVVEDPALAEEDLALSVEDPALAVEDPALAPTSVDATAAKTGCGPTPNPIDCE